MALTFTLAKDADVNRFTRVGEDLFDNAIDPSLLGEFLNDPRHHIVIADDDGLLVGFVSAVDYVHPDKPRQLFINEVAVASGHRRRGIGLQLMLMILEHARGLGCTEAWVLTDSGNEAANHLYLSSAPRQTVEPTDQVLYSFHLR